MQPHQDGPAYFPVVAILSLGSPVVMDFTPHSRFMETSIEEDKWLDNHRPFSVLLMPRSLLIFKDTAYTGNLLMFLDVIASLCSHYYLSLMN